MHCNVVIIHLASQNLIASIYVSFSILISFPNLLTLLRRFCSTIRTLPTHARRGMALSASATCLTVLCETSRFRTERPVCTFFPPTYTLHALVIVFACLAFLLRSFAAEAFDARFAAVLEYASPPTAVLCAALEVRRAFGALLLEAAV